MTDHVFEASADNFDALVLDNSRKGLVLVHYWSPKAGPCLLLNPRLAQLATDYGGRFLLVLVNTDVLGRLAREQGISSVPTVKFYLDGQVVHSIHGAESDAHFRAALGRFLAEEADARRLAALRAHQAGQTEEAIALLARVAVEHPEDLATAVDLAKLLTLNGQPERALELLASLPGEARLDGRVAPLLAHLELIDAARHGPDDAVERLAADPGDAEARLALAARALFDEQPEAALEHCLALALEQPGYRRDIGRRALLALFGMFGAEHPLTRRYRAKLAAGAR